MLQALPVLLPFLAVTLFVGITSIIGGSLFGGLLTAAKLSRHSLLRYLARAYTYIMRCTPSIVLLFIVFYGLPRLTEALFDYEIDDFDRSFFAIVTFVLLFGAYISEVFRSAYLAVPKGQLEAAVSMGLSPLQAVFQVVLPQAAVIALPNFGNSVINLLKEGALAYTIGLIDLLGKGNLIISQNFGAYAIEIYLVCMVIYWLMSLAIEKGFSLLESSLDKGQKLQVRQRSQAVKGLSRAIWLKGENAHGTGS